jgi:hypothetical protein
MSRKVATVVLFLGLGLAVTSAYGSPDIDGAVVTTRIFNDCPGSDVTFGNSYPASLWIMDEELACSPGWANRHNFRLSDNGGVTPAVFMNGDAFDLFADITITGPANSEGGLNVSPWWSQQVDGVFTAITGNGEIAAFGGRLPFYSFAAWMHDHAVTYTKGETITLGVKYRPNSLTEADPATIEYIVIKDGVTHSSGPRAFDQANPNEDPPYGLWGMLNDARVGGYFQPQINPNDPDNWGRIDFENISYDPDPPVSLALDIKPGSCPNSFNRGSHGVLPVGLLGTDVFDSATVDLATVALSRADGVGGSVAPHEGPPGPHSEFEDVGTPLHGDPCDCHEEEGDGFVDLSMKFKTDDVVTELELNALPAGALVELVVSGDLLDGTPFEASDCIRLVPPGTPPGLLSVGSDVGGSWVDVSPLDDTLDGGGFANFQRSFPMTTVVTLTAEQEADGQSFLGWWVNGRFHEAGQSTSLGGFNAQSELDTSIKIKIAGNETVYALYSSIEAPTEAPEIQRPTPGFGNGGR